MVVDDEASIASLFETILKTELPGLLVDRAHNGREALELFSRLHHSVLIMDLHMPVMDGQTSFLEIQRLCADRAWKMPAVIFCTALAPSGALQRMIRSSTDHTLLAKPVRMEAVVEAVRSRLPRG